MFETHVEEADDGAFDRVKTLLGSMKETDSWENIPTVRELMGLFKDSIPFRDDCIDFAYRMDMCSVIADSHVLDECETAAFVPKFV